MLVVKLGGSLLTSGWLKLCLDKLEQRCAVERIVIVPGGGVFADKVRDLQKTFRFNDNIAHEMAILAMQQMALLIKGLKPNFELTGSASEISTQLNHKLCNIWSPTVAELDRAGIKSSWDVTSDSLSAWLANKLGAEELILVKSVTIPNNFDVLKLAQSKIVDASLQDFTHQTAFKLTILHAKDFVS